MNGVTKSLAGHAVHCSPETGDTVTMATPLASQINAGTVLMVKGAWNDPFNALMQHLAGIFT